MIISWERSKHDQKIAIFRSEILSCLQIHILIIATNSKLQTYVDNKPRTEHIYIFTLRMDSYITWKLAIYILRQSTTKYPVLYSVYAQLTWHLPFCKRYFSKLVPLIHSISGKSYIHKYTSNISIVKTLVSCSLQQYHLPVLC